MYNNDPRGIISNIYSQNVSPYTESEITDIINEIAM